MSNAIEKITIDHSVNLNDFLLCLDLADRAEMMRFTETERAIGLLKLMRAQYSTLQDGRSIGKPPAVGEMPASIYLEVIQGIYSYKKRISEEQKQDFTLNYGNYRDFQVRQLKYYIETGDLLNNKKSTLQERVSVAIDRLEKKLKAEQAKLDKAKLDTDKARVKADQAAIEKAATAIEVDAIIDDVHQFIDDDPAGAGAIRDDLADIIETAEFLQKNAIEIDSKAQNEKVQAEKIQAKANANVDKTSEKLKKAKDKLSNFSAGKADNKKSEPNLDFKTTNFSKDCKDTASMLLTELEHETSAAELLYLAKLILDKYNK